MKLYQYNGLKNFLLYSLIIGLFLLQIPMLGSLPGKIDTWFYLATNEYLYNFIANGFSFENIGTILYPVKNFLSLGNLSVGFSLIYIPLRFINIDPIWIYWSICTFVYSLNATGFYLLSKEFKISLKWCLIGGIIFSCCNYLLANMDNLDGLCWGWGLIALAYLKKYLSIPQNKNLYISAFLIGLQFYFSSYMLFLTGLIWGSFLIYHALDNLTILKKVFLDTLISLSIILIIISPLVYVLFFNHNISQNFNFLNIKGANDTGLRFIDLINYLPNTYYSSIFLEAKDFWNEKAHAAGLGIITPLVGLYGLIQLKPNKTFWILMILILLLSMGSFIIFNKFRIFSPAYLIYESIGLGTLIRIKIRLYIFIVLILIIGWCYMMEKIEKEFGFKKIVAILVFIAIAENIPLKLRTYNSSEVIEELKEIAKVYSLKNKVVLNLPSSIYTTLYPPFFQNVIKLPDADQEMAIEHQYMYLQTLTKSKTINGNCAFIPQERIKNQINIFQIEKEKNLSQLIADNHLERIIIHKKNIPLMNDGRDLNYFTSSLKNYEKVHEDVNIIIYDVESIH